MGNKRSFTTRERKLAQDLKNTVLQKESKVLLVSAPLRRPSHPSFSSLPVVLQGSLHLEDVGAAVQPGWWLELLVQVRLLLQDLRWRRALPQPELHRPAVRLASSVLGKLEVHRA